MRLSLRDTCYPVPLWAQTCSFHRGSSSNSMLKITVADTVTERRILVCGKLVGLWIFELQSAWEKSCQQLGDRKLVVDLNDVTSIDHAGETLLSTIMRGRAELVASSTVNRWLIQTLKEGKTPAAARPLLPVRFDPNRPLEVDRSYVTTVAEGVVAFAELRAHLLREPQARALPHRELIDARRATLSLSSAEARELVELMRSFPRYGLGRTAIVVSNDVECGMLRMLQILIGDSLMIRPFRDLIEAERWLHN